MVVVVVEGRLGKRTKTVPFYYNSAAAWFLLLCASGSFASYMLLCAASYPLDTRTSVQQREWARGGEATMTRGRGL